METPKTIGKYNIRKRIISTRLSTLFAAEDPDLKVLVAIKVYDPDAERLGSKYVGDNKIWRLRFIEEAKVMAGFDHPFIVPVKYLSYMDDGKPYFVMPLMATNLPWEIGVDETDPKEIAKLSEIDKPKRLSLPRTFEILSELLSALSTVHRAGLVHRDIKPRNLLLTKREKGSIKLCDFGMVKNPENGLSEEGTWIGSRDYISPEQHESAAQADARADIYSVGVLAYRMLAGRLPAQDVVPVREYRPEVPEKLEDLLELCMSTSRNYRPANGHELAVKLQACFPR